MKTNKKEMKTFKITSRASEVLNWALGLGVVMAVLNFFDVMPTEVTTTAADGLSEVNKVVGDTFMNNALNVGIGLSQVTLLGVLLKAVNRKIKYRYVVALMVMVVQLALGVVVAAIPAGNTMMANGAYEMTNFGAFKAVLPVYINFFVYCAGAFLGYGLIKERGNVRRYGWALIFFPVLSYILGDVYTYLYNNVGGLTFQTLNTYHTIALVGQLLLWVGQMYCLRTTMSKDAEIEDGDSTDVNQFQ